MKRKYRIKEIVDEDGNSKFYPMYKDSNAIGYLENGCIKEFRYFTEWLDTHYTGGISRKVYFNTPQDVETFIEEDNYNRYKSLNNKVTYHDYKPSNIFE